MGQHYIPEQNLPVLKEVLEKLAKRALKLGSEPITLEVLRLEDVQQEDGSYERLAVVNVTGDSPKLNGWQLLAVLQHEENGNIIRKLPGLDHIAVPEKFKTAPRWCEACKSNRKRIDTYLVVRDEGRSIAQVGRNCLKDFTGHADPEAVARYLESIWDALDNARDDELCQGSGRGGRYENLVFYLSHVAAMIRLHGWVSGRAAREYDKASTRNMADYNISLKRGLVPRWSRETPVEPTEDDILTAHAAIAWATNIEPSDEVSDDYLWNLKIACSNETVNVRSLGIVASAIAAYRRATEHEQERKRQALVSNWLGQEGERLDLEVQVDSIQSFDGMYGTRWLHRMSDKAGNRLIWWATGGDLQEGNWYKLRGTVHRHSDYHGIKQTELKRCKGKPIPAPRQPGDELAVEIDHDPEHAWFYEA